MHQKMRGHPGQNIYLCMMISISTVRQVSKKAADTIFEAMYTLTDLRVLLRETAPFHKFDSSQRSQAEQLLEDLQQQVNVIRKELVE